MASTATRFGHENDISHHNHRHATRRKKTMAGDPGLVILAARPLLRLAWASLCLAAMDCL